MTKQSNSIAANTLFLVVGELGSKALGFALFIVIARILGAVDLGIMAFAISFAYLFELIANGGFSDLISRDVSRKPEEAGMYLSNMLLAKALLAVATIVAAYATVSMIGYDGEKLRAIQIVLIAMLFESAILCLNSFFRARQIAHYESGIRIFQGAACAVAGITMVLCGKGLIGVLWGRLVAQVVTAAICFVLVRTKVSGEFKPLALLQSLKLLRKALPFLLSGVFITIYIRCDVIMLSFMEGDETTGIYAAAQRFRDVFGFLPACLVGAILPVMAASGNRERIASLYARALKYLLVLSLPIAGGLTVFAPEIIHRVCGPEFTRSIPALRVLSWCLVFSFCNFCGFSVFASLNKEKQFSVLTAFGALFNIAANYILIRNFSYLGACVATLASEILVLACQLSYLKRKLGHIALCRIAFKPGIALAVMLATGFLLVRVNLILGVISCSVAYILILFVLGVFKREEFDSVFTMIGLKRAES
ncbi:flippase [Candidatus Hydrogenedentota bacterium]